MSRRGLAVRIALFGSIASGAAFVACSSFEADPTPPDEEAGADATTAGDTGGGEAGDAGDASPSDARVDEDATTVLAQGLTGLVGITVTDLGDVVVARKSGEIVRLPITGGDGGATLVIDKQTSLSALASVTGPTIMFATSESPSGKIARVDLDGSNYAGKNADGTLTAVTKGNTGSILALRNGGRIVRHQLDLGVVDVYPGLSPTDDIALSGNTLYWADALNGVVWKGDAITPSSVQYVTGETSCNGVAVDPFGVYWVTSTAVRARPLADGGGDKKTISAERAIAIAARDGTAYWITAGPPSSLRKADLTDDVGPRQTLASGFPADFTPSQKPIALTSTYVVWITSDGRVLRHDR